MSDETYITIVGRLTEDPQLRFTPSGAVVTNYTVAVTARRYDKQTNEWVDKITRFWRCESWNSGKLILAENVAEGLKKGDNVIAYGEIETRNFETKEGEKRTVVELRIESIGKNLKFHRPSIQSAPQQNAPQQNPNANTHQPGPGRVTQPQHQQPQQGGGWNPPPANDPWSQNANPNGGWGN